MSDLSKFSDTCAYCYKGVLDGISVCFCNNSLCNDHKSMHISKFGCDIHYSLFLCNGNVKIKCKEDVGDLEKRINIKIKNGMIKSNASNECSHIYDSNNISCDFDIKNIKCQECELSENLWVCLECGYVGCGRKQEGIKGNGHALSHFEATKKTNTTILIQMLFL
ncbi:uncharacterized protein VICG_00684 [Vittaforma corneae ATCC 50505]|uniref:UBP-type domain-containing protein n=1 Tax=Vittaforma corneae (strain ATCC 50505) TaxID=993615 RepID=L2GNT8_VITCO|nr:uncharacterized protein VICG_00684 [Vittaforma corneae ATCC 50505]ELA42284.1 hypothetical protein VICG_00684 [Vittaforma corneae ATCC 50505]